LQVFIEDAFAAAAAAAYGKLRAFLVFLMQTSRRHSTFTAS